MHFIMKAKLLSMLGKNGGGGVPHGGIVEPEETDGILIGCTDQLPPGKATVTEGCTLGTTS